MGRFNSIMITGMHLLDSKIVSLLLYRTVTHYVQAALGTYKIFLIKYISKFFI